MSKYKPYPAYKDSGVEWLGEVPEHWNLKRLKALLQERNEKNDPIKTRDILSLCMHRGVIPYAEKGSGGNKAKDDLTAYKLAYPGDIVLNSMNVIAGSVGLSKYFGAVSPVYYMLRPRRNQEFVGFYNHIFQAVSFQKSLYGLGNGILVKESSTGSLNTIRMRIPIEKLNNVVLPEVPVEEQGKILSFLDQETTKIDTLIEKQQKLIELLKEKRQAEISHAVKPSKSSNWERARLDWVCKIIRGNSSFKKDELLNSGNYVALQYGKTYKVDEINEHFNFYVNDEFYKQNQVVNHGDTILISTSETVEDLGHSCFYHREDDGLIGGEQILLKPNSGFMDSKFLYYSSKSFSEKLKKYAKGLKVFRFNIDNLKRIVISLPTKEEQKKISASLDMQTQKIDTLIEKSETSIELLKERKTALISAAVTGKIDVRDCA